MIYINLPILIKLKEIFIKILKKNLVGIYIHGSGAYGCFNHEFSDIDLIIVVEDGVSIEDKKEILNNILNIWHKFPKKGLEFSIVKKECCLNVKGPITYELHFSESWIKIYKENMSLVINNELKQDWDLVTYFRIIYERGIVLYGQPIMEVFSYITNTLYMYSIYLDVRESYKELKNDAVSVILNLCRCLAFIDEEKILSKKEAGEWCINKKIVSNEDIIKKHIQAYLSSDLDYVKNTYEDNLFIYIELYAKIVDIIYKNNKNCLFP